MSLQFDLYWSFRSPYCYLATGRIVELRRKYDLEVDVKVVLPIESRVQGFFDKANARLLSYGLMDQRRLAAYYGIDFQWPKTDPIVQDLETGRVANEQPYIHRLARLGVAAAESGDGLAYIDEVSRLIWNGREAWEEGDNLARAAGRAGFDLTRLEAKVEADPDRYDAVLAENGRNLEAAGHWGTPSMVFDGEIFFGQDRLDLLLWRMQQKGLVRKKT